MCRRQSRWSSRIRKLLAAGLPLSFFVGADPLQGAESAPRFRVQTSVVTEHYSRKPEHNNDQQLLDVEVSLTDRQAQMLRLPSTDDPTSPLNDVSWSAGLATFRNSYSQRSVYGYIGGRYRMTHGSIVNTYIKLTAGLMHGYRGEHRDRIPLNQLGVAPVVLPAAGLEFGRAHVELVFFGNRGLMLTTGFAF